MVEFILETLRVVGALHILLKVMVIGVIIKGGLLAVGSRRAVAQELITFQLAIMCYNLRYRISRDLICVLEHNIGNELRHRFVFRLSKP